MARALQEGVVAGLANHTALIARDGTEWQIADSCAPIPSEECLEKHYPEFVEDDDDAERILHEHE